MDVFVPYSGLHAVSVAVCALLIAAPTLFARALDKNAERVLRRSLAATAVCYWIAYNTWWNWHGIDLPTGLPLHSMIQASFFSTWCVHRRART